MEGAMPQKFILQADLQPNDMDFGRLSFLSHPSTTGAKHLTILFVSVLPGKGHDFHYHPNQEEVIYVLSGTVEAWVEREKRILGPGDGVFVPPGIIYGAFNAGSHEARVLPILGPSISDMGIEIVDVSGEAPWNTLRANKA
jgi:quercetin dioxygenase-like cupin family protein